MSPETKLLLDEISKLFATQEAKWDALFSRRDARWEASTGAKPPTASISTSITMLEVGHNANPAAAVASATLAVPGANSMEAPTTYSTLDLTVDIASNHTDMSLLLVEDIYADVPAPEESTQASSPTFVTNLDLHAEAPSKCLTECLSTNIGNLASACAEKAAPTSSPTSPLLSISTPSLCMLISSPQMHLSTCTHLGFEDLPRSRGAVVIWNFSEKLSWNNAVSVATSCSTGTLVGIVEFSEDCSFLFEPNITMFSICKPSVYVMLPTAATRVLQQPWPLPLLLRVLSESVLVLWPLAIKYVMRQPWPPPAQMEFPSGDVVLRPIPWPSFEVAKGLPLIRCLGRFWNFLIPAAKATRHVCMYGHFVVVGQHVVHLLHKQRSSVSKSCAQIKVSMESLYEPDLAPSQAMHIELQIFRLVAEFSCKTPDVIWSDVCVMLSLGMFWRCIVPIHVFDQVDIKALVLASRIFLCHLIELKAMFQVAEPQFCWTLE